MQRLLTEDEKAEIIEREWAKARAKNPKVVSRRPRFLFLSGPF
jgi:hypothetical protein